MTRLAVARVAGLALVALSTGCSGAANEGDRANDDVGTSEWAHWPMPNPSSEGLPNPARYTDNGDGSVLDEVTGLVWQREVDPRAFTIDEARAHCRELGPEPRLPTAIELISLVDFARPSPTIDPIFSAPLDYFWSSTPLSGDDSRTWLVYFGDGHASDGTNTSKDRVRCVRSALSAGGEHYEAVPGGVRDRGTGLVWEARASAERFTFEDAQARCSSAGYRAPSMKELQTLVDRSRVRPSIDETAFPDTEHSGYWTSSSVADNPALAWVVNFELGRSDMLETEQLFPVRCVR